MPAPDGIDTTGLDVSAEDLAELLRVDPDGLRQELPTIHEHFAQFGDRLPRGAAGPAGGAGEAARGLEELATSLHDADSAVRMNAVHELGVSEDPRAVLPLYELVQDEADRSGQRGTPRPRRS